MTATETSWMEWPGWAFIAVVLALIAVGLAFGTFWYTRRRDKGRARADCEATRARGVTAQAAETLVSPHIELLLAPPEDPLRLPTTVCVDVYNEGVPPIRIRESRDIQVAIKSGIPEDGAKHLKISKEPVLNRFPAVVKPGERLPIHCCLTVDEEAFPQARSEMDRAFHRHIRDMAGPKEDECSLTLRVACRFFD